MALGFNPSLCVLNEKENRAEKWQKLGKEMMDVLGPRGPRSLGSVGWGELRPSLGDSCPGHLQGIPWALGAWILQSLQWQLCWSPWEQSLGMKTVGPWAGSPQVQPALPKTPAGANVSPLHPGREPGPTSSCLGSVQHNLAFLGWIFLLLSCYFRLCLGNSQFSPI